MDDVPRGATLPTPRESTDSVLRQEESRNLSADARRAYRRTFASLSVRNVRTVADAIIGSSEPVKFPRIAR